LTSATAYLGGAGPPLRPPGVKRCMATQLKILAACLLPLATVHAQPEDKPRLVPLFSNAERGPAFMLECRNMLSVAIRAGEVLGGLVYQVTVLSERKYIAWLVSSSQNPLSNPHRPGAS